MPKWVEEAKTNVARKSLDEIQDGNVLGIGSGSTIKKFIELLGTKIHQEHIQITTIPSSIDSEHLLIKNEIPVTSLLEHSTLDLAVDGADEVSPQLNLIKGGGGCMFREKVIAAASKQLIILIDERKLVDTLGALTPVPVAVQPFALGYVQQKIKQLNGEAKLRTANRKMGPIITDDGHFILDVRFRNQKHDKRLEKQINSIPGVVENGLFINMTNKVYVGGTGAIKILTK